MFPSRPMPDGNKRRQTATTTGVRSDPSAMGALSTG
jgi:hypothetical protein